MSYSTMLHSNEISTDKCTLQFSTWIQDPELSSARVVSRMFVTTGNARISMEIDPANLHALKAAIDEQLDNLCKVQLKFEELMASKAEVQP